MGLYLHCEIESSLSPDEFRERVIVPLGEALGRERLGCILDRDAEEKPLAKDHYELAMEVTDTKRAMDVMEAVLEAVDDVKRIHSTDDSKRPQHQ